MSNDIGGLLQRYREQALASLAEAVGPGGYEDDVTKVASPAETYTSGHAAELLAELTDAVNYIQSGGEIADDGDALQAKLSALEGTRVPHGVTPVSPSKLQGANPLGKAKTVEKNRPLVSRTEGHAVTAVHAEATGSPTKTASAEEGLKERILAQFGGLLDGEEMQQEKVAYNSGDESGPHNKGSNVITSPAFSGLIGGALGAGYIDRHLTQHGGEYKGATKSIMDLVDGKAAGAASKKAKEHVVTEAGEQAAKAAPKVFKLLPGTTARASAVAKGGLIGAATLMGAQGLYNLLHDSANRGSANRRAAANAAKSPYKTASAEPQEKVAEMVGEVGGSENRISQTLASPLTAGLVTGGIAAGGAHLGLENIRFPKTNTATVLQGLGGHKGATLAEVLKAKGIKGNLALKTGAGVGLLAMLGKAISNNTHTRALQGKANRKATEEAGLEPSLAKAAAADQFPNGVSLYEFTEGPGFNAPGTELIRTNDKAVGFTKRDAKAPQIPVLSSNITEPALSAATDPVVQRALSNASEAGVKTAGLTKGGVRRLLLGGV